ncbi:HIRA-interacting protein 3 isoform X2 [Tenrec ecaudatus]|uniref:HIRA-interacting protein 3 isoform X2 n=1 Tax=Tenrec ecaudatus TaxID=94439 RepID=UPI003F5A2BEE
MARFSEMQEFTRSLFRGQPDLSTLTQSIVRRRFQAHVGRDHLEPEEKRALKRLVEQELLKMQADEASTKKMLDLKKKAERSPTSSSDRERKRFRVNSESGLSSAASSPDHARSPAENGLAAAEFSPLAKGPRRTSKRVEEESRTEDAQQGPLMANQELEDGVEDSSEEEEEFRGRSQKKTGTKKPTAARKLQARRESEDSEEELLAQRMRRKGRGQKGAKSHRERETGSAHEHQDTSAMKKGQKGAESDHERETQSEDEDQETPAKEESGEEKGGEEEEACVSRAPGSGQKRLACKEGSSTQKGKAGRLMGDQADPEVREEREAASSEDSTSGEEPLPEQRKHKARTQHKGGKRQSGSSEEEDDGDREARLPKSGTRKTAMVDSSRREGSDLESAGEAGGSPKGEKNQSSKSSKKGRARSSSTSSSEGSPDSRGRKAATGRRSEDHPAVQRLKRYIRACGAYRNYKKLLGSCRSHKECLKVLRAELEALGMKGNPSMVKCRALKEQREEAAEVASLDVTNIISSSGRPRRRTAWNPSGESAPVGEPYSRTLDSEDERPHHPPPDWSHLRGIISSDGDST